MKQVSSPLQRPQPRQSERASSVKRKGCPVVEVGSKLHRKTSNVDCAHDRGMANKENELTCSDDIRRNCGLPVNSGEGSKMAGATSKYSDFTELSKDHEAMTHILFGRNLRLKVAQTLWRRNASELVAYLIRIQDTGVLLDCLPVLTNDLQNEAPCLSLGCCVDLMPQVRVIIASKYEEHIKVGLHWVQSVIRKWWPELSKKERRLQDSCSEDRQLFYVGRFVPYLQNHKNHFAPSLPPRAHRNIEVMKQRLKEIWKEGSQICSVPGPTGEQAKAIEASLSQLP